MEGLAKEIGRPFESVRGKFSAERQKYSDMYNDPLVVPNRYSANELKVLRESFEKNEWPDEGEKQRLSLELNKPYNSIDKWFLYERKSLENPGKNENKGKSFTVQQIKI